MAFSLIGARVAGDARGAGRRRQDLSRVLRPVARSPAPRCIMGETLMVIAIDGPAGAGKSTRRQGGRGSARLHLPRHRRDVPLRRAREPATRGDPGGARAADTDLAGRPRAARRRGRHRRDPHARGLRARLAGRGRPGGAPRDGRASSGGCMASGDWVAEGRDIGTVVAPDAELKVFLTADPAERARRRAASWAWTPTRCWPSRRSATSATAPAPTRRCGRRDGAVELDTTGLTLDAGRRAIVGRDS